MVISVLERRAEIGLRRSLGATRRHIRIQFLTESLLLSVLGGGAGILLGSGATAGYATLRDWPTVVPLGSWPGHHSNPDNRRSSRPLSRHPRGESLPHRSARRHLN